VSETQQEETNTKTGSLFNWLFCGFFKVMNKYRHLPSWQKWIIGLIAIFGIYRFLPIWEIFKLFAYIVFAPLVGITICLILFEDALKNLGFKFEEKDSFSTKWESCLKENCELLYSLWEERTKVEEVQPLQEEVEEVK
jgi:hypothetical protein